MSWLMTITVKWQILKFDTIFHLYDKSEYRHHSIVYDMKNIIIYIYAFMQEQICQQFVKESTID